MKNKRIIAFAILFLLACFLVGYLYFNKPATSNGVNWNGKQDIKTEQKEKYIAIPGFNRLSFVGNKKVQKVNLYNPSENSCTMTMEMFLANGTSLWKADNIQPGNGFYEIELKTTLDSGTYENCILNIKCYDKNGTELNGGKMNFTLFVN